MANTSRRTGKRAAPGRDGLRARKPGSSKAAKPESRKSNPANKRTSAAAPKAIRKERSDLASVASLRARMTAASRVLELIAGSRSDSQPVFDAIAASARDLTGAMCCSMVRLEDGLVKIAASSGWSDGALAAMNRAYPRPAGRDDALAAAIMNGEVQNVADILDSNANFACGLQAISGYRSILVVPIMQELNAVGAICLFSHQVARFQQSHIDLLKTFASQALIAIVNAQLFNEVQNKSRELQEALRYQAGSANILNVIASSPTEVEPVLKAIVESACKLCEAHDAVVLLKEGNDLCFSAHHGPIPINMDRWQISRGWASGRAVVDRAIVHEHDIYAENDFIDSRELSRRAGSTAVRSILAAPLLRKGESIGAILLRRQEVRPFNDKQIAMLQTFADQAVIAIENARLFDEVQQRTRELSKSLDELRTAQDRLVQTEKLASLGQLTAGIAHEIKNPLNFVNNFSTLAVELLDELDETLVPAPLDQKMRGNVGELTAMLKSNLEKVVQHGKRADSIIKNMLQHSRGGSGEPRAADVNVLVGESLSLAYHGARAENPVCVPKT
jgi:two-component system, NtrC family, sensor kinase